MPSKEWTILLLKRPKCNQISRLNKLPMPHMLRNSTSITMPGLFLNLMLNKQLLRPLMLHNNKPTLQTKKPPLMLKSRKLKPQLPPKQPSKLVTLTKFKNRSMLLEQKLLSTRLSKEESWLLLQLRRGLLPNKQGKMLLMH